MTTSIVHFIPEISVLAKYTGAILVLFVMPGPDMSLCLSKTISSGKKAAFQALSGILLGCSVHTLLAAFSVSAILIASDYAFLTLKILGALYLLWLGINAVRFGSKFELDANAETAPDFKKNFLVGLGINLANPKVVLFFMTFLPQFVALDDPYAKGKLVFLGLYFVVISMPLMSMLILGADRIVLTLRNNPIYLRALDYIFCGVFVSFAVGILLTENRLKS